jgi:hypothetical protein
MSGWEHEITEEARKLVVELEQRGLLSASRRSEIEDLIEEGRINDALSEVRESMGSTSTTS